MPASSASVSRKLPIRTDEWEEARLITDYFLQHPDRSFPHIIYGGDPPDTPTVPSNPSWIFDSRELMVTAFLHPVPSLFFPPAEQAEEVKAAWRKGQRDIEDWEGFRSVGVQPVRREERIGRNDPCPCQSGKKHKQCCLGKPKDGLTDEQRQAAALAAREDRFKERLKQLNEPREEDASPDKAH